MVDQCPELGSPTSEAQVWHPARTPRPCQPHGKREKGKKYIYIIAPKVHHLNFEMIGCLFRYSQMQGTSSWLWRFNPLLLRLLGEISLSLLCSHSSWGSALDLDPPLRVGRLRASVLCSDRTGLKEQLIRGLWLTQAGGREGYGCGASLRRQRPAWHCNSLRHPVCSPGDVVPGSRDPGRGGSTGSCEGRCG